MRGLTCFVCVLLAAACGGDDETVTTGSGGSGGAGGAGGSGGGVDGPPSVVSTVPDDLEADVDPDAPITATFSESIDDATLDDTAFVVTQGDTTVPGTLSYDDATTTATFQSDRRLSLRQLYGATVGPGVTDVGGEAMTAAHSFSFAVREGVWGSAGIVDSENDGHASDADIAVDPAGNGIAVWRQNDGMVDSMWAARYVPGSGWGSAELIESDDVGDAYGPKVALDPSGNGIAVWRQDDGVRTNVWANRYTVGTGWGGPELIETDDVGSAFLPTVAVDARGHAVAIWLQNDGNANDVMANHFDPNGGWGTAQPIDDSTPSAGELDVSVDDAGNAIALWIQGTRIWTNRYEVSNGWGTAEMLDLSAGDNRFGPDVAVQPNGESAVAVWRQGEVLDGNLTMWASVYTSTSGWGSLQIIAEPDTSSPSGGTVAIDAAGNAIAVWGENLTSAKFWANRYVPGMGWGTREPISGDANGSSVPMVAIDAAGQAIVVFSLDNGTEHSIWANRFLPESGWGGAEQVEMDDVGPATSPQIAMDASGSALAVWSQHDGTWFDIQANTFR